MAKNKLIKCADHKWAPWGIVCVHLVKGTSTEWLPMPQAPGSECENDWLCPACAAKLPEPPVEDLKAICIHCIRKLRERRSKGR